MHGKTLGKSRIADKKRGAFSLIELLIVILIMAAVIGVVASLLAGYTRMFNETDDQAVARQRAQDVFNAIEVPVVSVALGIPTDKMSYFDPAPIALWRAPMEIKKSGSGYAPSGTSLSGDVLRLVYSVPSGVKHGQNRVSDFTPPSDGTLYSAMLELTGELSADLVALNGSANDTRKFITFPTAFMSPLKVTARVGKQIQVLGLRQPEADSNTHSELAKLIRGEIAPYHDVHLVRAIAAYVDSGSVFHAAEVNATDVSATDPTNVTNPTGLRVDGIKAVQFETDDDRKLFTVRVLAEGEIIDEMRRTNTPTRNAIRARWDNIALDDKIFYADFEMTWRIRNYVPN